VQNRALILRAEILPSRARRAFKFSRPCKAYKFNSFCKAPQILARRKRGFKFKSTSRPQTERKSKI